ncbi:MAG TPA: hypothetical protein VFY75_11200 [Solirubrobacterales bacterium]|nr:hypothetical protein [Solirubrobacterales bacterium]
MTPLTTKSRRPLSHEWRRHSLVRVRRPAWSAHAAEGEAERNEQPITPEAPASKAHTTHDDIAW